MAVTCIGKKLQSAEGNILSTQNNVIQATNNRFQFSANKIMLYVYMYRICCHASVLCVVKFFVTFQSLHAITCILKYLCCAVS